MSKIKWFSTKLRFAVMVEPTGGDVLNDRVIVLKAVGFKDAFNKALSIGRALQNEYLNAHGQRVQWKLVKVISLDIIQSEDLDGREVYSEPIHLNDENRIPFETKFDPESSEPIQTI